MARKETQSAPAMRRGSRAEAHAYDRSAAESHRDETEYSPDRFLTVYGRKPVWEALNDLELDISKVVLAKGLHGSALHEITQAAEKRGIPVRRATPQRVKILAGNGRQDQGIVADVRAHNMRPLAEALAEPAHAPRRILLLDGITTPANVGMILRSATASGVDGIVVPHQGVAGLDPLVVKASAGIAFRAPILRVSSAAVAAEMLSEAGYPLFALDSHSGESIFQAEFPRRMVFAVGSETHGLSTDVWNFVERSLRIPMRNGVESLNVADATAIVGFELLRRTET